MNASVTEEIKQRIDIVELISRYVPTLRRAGSSYKGNCPFHEERTPSFVVFPHTGTWHCFGACGVGGDAFSFLMRKENLDFPEALQQLADEVGVEVRSQEEAPARQKRNVLYEVNQAAADYYRILLHRSPLAQEARTYLQARHIDSQTAEHFQLGFALNSWDSLRNFLLEKGYQQQDLLDAGLLKHNQERGSTYDAFRSRLMIGTALYPSPEIMRRAIEASGAEIVTVSLRRQAPGQAGGARIWDFIAGLGCCLLPNTAGCHSEVARRRCAGDSGTNARRRTSGELRQRVRI